MKKAFCIPTWSATKPVHKGTIAPPAIEEVSTPDPFKGSLLSPDKPRLKIVGSMIELNRPIVIRA